MSNEGRAAQPAANGKPGDFDFLTGEWTIAHRRLVNNQWDAFDGAATVRAMLDGVASVEELRISSRNFSAWVCVCSTWSAGCGPITGSAARAA